MFLISQRQVSKDFKFILTDRFKQKCHNPKKSQNKLASSLGAILIALTGCTPTPPDYREQVTAPVYEAGDIENGKALYNEYCEQCHKLTPGSNKKGPQLLGVYHAPSAILEDYNYSDAMDNASLVWDAQTLDNYIADPEAALPETRMLSDPIPDEKIRKDIIAYISTLGRDAPPLENGTK